MACFRKIDIAAPKKVANQKGYDLRNGCKKKVEFGLLSFEIDPGGPEEDKPALVVDGQHRLLGIGSYGKEDIPIFIACLLDADLAEQAFQFIVINNKAVRVSADNVKSIIARQYDEPKLNERLEKSGVRYGQAVSFLKEANEDKRSPFAKILDWEFNKDESSKIVPITAVEACVRMIRARFEMLQEDQDSLLSLLYAIWAPVKKSYSGLWAKDSKLMTKVCITTLNEFLVDRLHFNWEEGNVDIFESKEVSECVESMVQKIPTQFWESEWNILIQDNANIRKIIKDDLTRIVSNLRQKKVWSEGAVVLAQHEDD
jgi:DGQHR domain-containing protein